GQVRVLGRDPQVPAERTDIRRQLGYQPQEIGFPRGFTAFAFVDYIALLKEWTQPAARHAEVRRVLDLVGLSDLGTKRMRAGSGWPTNRTRRRASPGGPAPAGTATSAPASGTTSSTSNRPSKTRTCCCAAGHRSTSPPGRWRRDLDAHVRPARNLPRAGHV